MMSWIRPRFRLGTLATGTLVIGLVMALVAQQRAADRRERALKARLGQSLLDIHGQDGMRSFMGDLGIVVLKEATSFELLAISSPAGDQAGQDAVIPTGREVDPTIARRLANALLEPANYAYVNGDDLPDPQFGIRLRRGGDMFDILISLESTAHQDVWAVSRVIQKSSDRGRRAL